MEDRPMRPDELRLQKKARELLASLGKDARAVALRLARAGAKGRRQACGACPLAAFLAMRLGGRWEAGEAGFAERSWPWRPESLAALPAGARAFMEAFDAGAFPDLEG